MGTISVSLPTDGTTADVADVNTPITTIVNEFNGNIDNNNIKAGAAIATSKLANDSGIGPSKLGLGGTTATVATSEGTASTSYVSLSTTTDQVTVTIGNNGLALVMISCIAGTTASDGTTAMSYAVSGASTTAASDAESALQRITTATGQGKLSYATLLTGLTPGSTTFAAKYRVGSGTGSFQNRKISVIPL